MQQKPKRRKSKFGYTLLILLIICMVNIGIINIYIFISEINNKNMNIEDINKIIDKSVQEFINKYISDDNILILNDTDEFVDFIDEIEEYTAEEATAKTVSDDLENNEKYTEEVDEVSEETMQYIEIDEIISDNLLYIDSPYYEPEIPALFNRNNYIPEDYQFDLVYIDSTNSHRLDARAYHAFRDMMEASRKDGVSLWVVSAYRSHARQTNNFNNNINILMSYGYSRDEAYAETSRYIAIPGTSEHETGLAIDFNLIDERFDQTREYAWLINNCADYGFIPRYQKDTEHITNIIYEPWHYRYVGINHAKKIVELDITLEEYVSILKKYE